MSFVSAQKSRVLAGDFSLSAKITKVSMPWSPNMLDTTTLADGAKTFIPGQDTSTWSLEGLYDELDHADGVAWPTTGNPISYGPQGLALSSEVWLGNALNSSFEETSSVGSTVNFKIDAQTTGITTPGVSLKDLAAVTVDTNGTANDLGSTSTTGGAVAHLHVTAFSGFSGAVVIVEDSANNSVFATIGTFTTVAGATSERIAIAGTVRRYVRTSVDVTGSGTITHAVTFARL